MSGLASMYDLKDENQAKEYLEKIGIEYRFQCYGENLPDGCHRLAEFLDAFRKDTEKARVVFEKNCIENKHAMSCYKLGQYNLTGTGGEKNVDAALQHYISGCNYGYAPSCDNAGTLYMDKHRRGGRYNPELALPYFEKACKMKDVKACQKLSALYIQGKEGIERDMKKAFAYGSEACELGDYKGCMNVSLMYKRGDGVAADSAMAEKFKEQAIKMHKEKIDMKQQIKFGE